MIIKGKLIECKRTVKEYDNKRRSKEKLFISLAEAEITDEQWDEIKAAYVDAGKNYTPDWVKDFKGYVNIATNYDLPCRDHDKVEHPSIEKAIEEGLKWIGAEVKISINIKEGAIYPNAILFLTEGGSFNAFAELDEE